MYKNDMKLKIKRGLEKVNKAIESHNGCTLLSTGITGDDARMAKAAVEAGAKMLEPNHPAWALARGYHGVKSMHEAEKIRYEVTVDDMAMVTRGIRNVVPEDVFITVGIPGGFTELMPVKITEEDLEKIALAGADGLHIHKSSLDDLEEVVNMAHKYGLLVDAYIAHPEDQHLFGIPAETPEEVAEVAKAMENIGVDMIGLMTGMSYEGVKAGEIHPHIKLRLEALVSAVDTPTLAEGGINPNNFKAFKETGVNILVVGTAIDDLAREAVKKGIRTFI